MNVELLTKVMDRLREPEVPDVHFDMDSFVKVKPCGTAACIAGHALIIEGYALNLHSGGRVVFREEFLDRNGAAVSADDEAQRLLELDENEAERLFMPDHWPTEFGGYDEEEDRDEDPALYNDPKVAADRIQRFIDTDGAE